MPVGELIEAVYSPVDGSTAQFERNYRGQRLSLPLSLSLPPVRLGFAQSAPPLNVTSDK